MLGLRTSGSSVPLASQAWWLWGWTFQKFPDVFFIEENPPKEAGWPRELEWLIPELVVDRELVSVQQRSKLLHCEKGRKRHGRDVRCPSDCAYTIDNRRGP